MTKLLPQPSTDAAPNGSDTTVAATDDAELAKLAKAINEFHVEGTRLLGDAIDRFAAAGEALLTAKDKLKHGQWLPWLKENFPFTPRTAQLYMMLATYLNLSPDLRSKTHGLSLNAAIEALQDQFDKRRWKTALDLRAMQTDLLRGLRQVGAILAAIKELLGSEEAFAKWADDTFHVPARQVRSYIGSSETIDVNAKSHPPVFLQFLPMSDFLAALDVEEQQQLLPAEKRDEMRSEIRILTPNDEERDHALHIAHRVGKRLRELRRKAAATEGSLACDRARERLKNLRPPAPVNNQQRKPS